jgi:uncharacterized membrane protein YcjF (UPF0283 family)
MGEDQALERLAEILARPEYQAERSVPWWQQAFGPVLDLIAYVLARLVQALTDSATGREGWLGIVVLGVCAVLIVVVVVYLARAVRLSVTRDTRLTSASLSERRERSDQLWRSAERFAASGELAEAVRLLYLSALYALDERALLHVERALTNREHARRLDQVHPTLGQTFGEIVDRYERVRYGSFAVAPEFLSELSDLVARLRSAALLGMRPERPAA